LPREIRKLLEDIHLAASDILDFTRGKSADDFSADRQLQSAIYFQFMIIGEAMSKLRQEDEQAYDAVSDNFRIVGFRNLIAHGYFNLQSNLTWQTIHERLPTLIKEIEGLQRGR
jgi:uncharacterized protein with HEPN domain